MLPLLIARRHLLSRKSHTVINLLCGVSAAAIAVPVMAMVVILSFHNGLSRFIEQLYSEFDPQVSITARDGGRFHPSDSLCRQIEALPQVAALSATLEENVLVRYQDRQWIGTLRGVDTLYKTVIPIESRMIQGSYTPRLGDLERAVVGQGTAYTLGLNLALYQPLEVYAIRPGRGASWLPTTLFQSGTLVPAGIYALDQQTDNRYLFVPIEFAERLLESPGSRTSLAVRLNEGVSMEQGAAAIAPVLPPELETRTRWEQKSSLYAMIQQEKWLIFALLLFVVLITALSLAGSVVMLATDKQRDRLALRAMGLGRGKERLIFVWEGSLITLTGVAAGLLLGVGFALAQQHWGFIRLSGDSFLIESYPVEIMAGDLLRITLFVLLLGVAVSALTAAVVLKRTSNQPA